MQSIANPNLISLQAALVKVLLARTCWGLWPMPTYHKL